ncbi:hypothetical protein VTN31DRAFT_7044 [Thermomyces dupontii]|uniref:uncharacterized protein n=1 Tax=Talaromyces thermophilus TaxID=28565 RepID=UPI00374373AA
MSDTEEWQPNPRRPQSTMAQAFSVALDNAFMLDNDINHLDQTVQQKKQMMTIRERELQALQQKIRETEERLKEQEERLNKRRSQAVGQPPAANQDTPDSSAATSNGFDHEGDDDKGKAATAT